MVALAVTPELMGLKNVTGHPLVQDNPMPDKVITNDRASRRNASGTRLTRMMVLVAPAIWFDIEMDGLFAPKPDTTAGKVTSLR
jgi:hypothetical protein